MKDNPKLRKNGGSGTFFGNLWRAVVKNNIPLGETIVDAIDKKDFGKIFESISNDSKLTEYQCALHS